MMLSHRVFHPVCHGQWAGRCSVGLAGGCGEAGGHVDQVAAQGGAARDGVLAAGEGAGGAQQVVRDHRAAQPGAVRGEQPGRDVRQRPVDQVGEGGLDDGVVTVGLVGLSGGQVGVGEKRVIPPHREQRVGVAGVADPAHHQPGGEAAMAPHGQGVGWFRRPRRRRSARRCRGLPPRPGSAPG